MPLQTTHAFARLERLTVRQQIGWAAAILSVIIVAVVAGSAAYLGARQASAFIRQDLAGTAKVFADRLDRSLATRYREVRIFSELEPLRSAWLGDRATLRGVLEELQEGYSDYSWIGFATTDGIVRAATGGLLEGVSVAAQSWFKNGLYGPTVGDVREVQLLAKLLGPRPAGDLFRFVDIAFPVRNANRQVVGVLCAHLSWDFAASLRQSMLDPVDPASGTELLVLARDGSVLLGAAMQSMPFTPAQLTELRAGRASALLHETTSKTMLVAAAAVGGRADYPSLGWTVVARQSNAAAVAPINRMVLTITGLGISVAAVGIVLALFIAGRIAKPIHAVTLEADRIGREHELTMLSRHGGSYEVVQLSAALRSLLRRVGVAEQRSRAAEAREAEGAQQYVHDIQILRRMADTDPLTNLMNRRAFLAASSDALEYFRRYQRLFAVLVIDIDHFKNVNDTYGHATGDAVIKRTGELIEQTLRTTDKVARFGGEEFVVLLREVDEIGVRAFSRRIVEVIADTAIDCGNKHIHVTVSIGVAVAVDSDRDIQETIERADRALYMAKNTGRNRAFTFPAYDTASQKVA